MATPFTGSLGWTGAHPVQLGGPPLINTYSRPLASKSGPLGAEALPLLAHAYANDGVTPNATSATFGILNRPNLKATTTNGGFDQITLEVAAPIPGLAQGNVIRLTEIGGPWAGFVYGGVIESFPDTLSPTGTKHEIVVSPFGWELTRVASQAFYTAAADIAQVFRDAVALTQHCSCDQVSVPPTTGITLAQSGNVDFRGQKVNQVLDTVRSIAGPTWFWYCDELGRTWLQSQGSSATYTFMGGQHYEERVTNGGDIQDRINQVLAIGAVPLGGSAPVNFTANGASQSTIGIRALDPPIQLPGVADQPTVTAIANGILATLDQTWTRFTLKGLPPLGIANEHHPGRVHGSQPGGAMVRYWEPGKTPMSETGAVAGYTGPFICQSIDYDGLTQQIEAGSIPVTSQTDIDNLVKSWANRAAAISLNVPLPTLSGQTVLQTATASSPGGRLSVADLTPRIRTDFGNLPAYIDPAGTISPAGYGVRVIRADGILLFDSVGISVVMTELGHSFLASLFTTASATPVLVTGSAVTFTLTRNSRVDVRYAASCSYGGAGTATGIVDLFVDGTNESAGGNGPAIQLQFAPTTSGAATSGATFSTTLTGSAAGISHTIDLRASQSGTPAVTLTQAALIVYLIGG